MMSPIKYPVVLTNIAAIRPSEEVDEQSVVQLAERILSEAMWIAPIVIEKATGVVMDGNHRLRAGRMLGLTLLPCIHLEYGDPRVSVQDWHTGSPFQIEAIFHAINQDRVLPYKSTRHSFDPPLPTTSISLETLLGGEVCRVSGPASEASPGLSPARPAKDVQTLVDVLHQRACQTPDAIAYRFIQGAALSVTELHYGELWLLVRRLGDELQLRGLAGTQVLLVCKSQRNFVVSFFACLAAGVVAVPTALPRRKALIGRLQLLLDDAQVSAILSDANEVQGLATGEGALSYVDLELWMQQQAAQPVPPIDAIATWTPPLAAGVAFLQYTSGSTGDPKGVVVTHANLMSNSAVIQQAMGISAASSVFTALPLFHDMGLVGGVLQPMFAGCVGHCMSPTEFVQYPERWLQFMSAFKISVSGGPNFMYELAARSITDEQIAGCDLSHWKVAFCGAEPIRAETVKLFVSRFEGFGFDASAFYPCYGMAESTLFITGKADGTPLNLREHQGGKLVGCGMAYGDTTVLIVDPDTRVTLPPGEVGEIWVRGTSVAGGYWRRPELSAATFQARLAQDDGHSYLRTGDLGFICDGEMYITSRLKDVIVVYGKKYSPQDLEADAEASHVALSERGAAAFSFVREGRERVVVVAELRRPWLRRHEEWPHVVSAVRAAISVAHGLVVDEVVLIKPTTLPRTSSGKVRRAQCRGDYLAALLDIALPLETPIVPATHDAVAHTLD